jgi:hypothetical protein
MRPVLQEDDIQQFRDLNRKIERLQQSLIPEAPHYIGEPDEPAFQNSWANFDALDPPDGRSAYFYRHAGRVYLGGVIKSGATGTTAFVLPTGYLFAHTSGIALPVAASGGVAILNILSTGAVQPQNQGTTAVVTYCFLEGVSFRHA